MIQEQRTYNGAKMNFKWCWENCIYCKSDKLSFYNIHVLEFKWIKDLNVSPETIKFLEENLGDVLHIYFNLRDNFVNFDFKSKGKQKQK